ncbi:MAG: hypothetical protein ACD_33C00046G0003 [uncultured bacterium]|nr:MAG: hypothetical protein ACD_33C00046G0003 [uncultured bacterium]
MKIDSLMTNTGPAIFHDQAFLAVLEDHMSYLRSHPTTVVLNIDPNKAYKYEFDLNGLLLLYSVPTYLHWLTMRMNNMTSPTDYRKDKLILLVPNDGIVGHIRQSHTSTRRVD